MAETTDTNQSIPRTRASLNFCMHKVGKATSEEKQKYIDIDTPTADISQ